MNTKIEIEIQNFETIIDNAMEILESTSLTRFQFLLNCSRIKFAGCKIDELKSR